MTSTVCRFVLAKRADSGSQAGRTALRTLLCLSFAAGLAGLSSGADAATTEITTVHRMEGGPGGREAQLLCPEGSYVVGLHGRGGDFIDAIGILCANRSGSKAKSGLYGGGGGAPLQIACSSPTAAVRTLSMVFTTSGGRAAHLLRSVLECAEAANGTHQQIAFGPQPGGGRRLGASQSCDLHEHAIGIQVRSGQYVDAIGLICGRIIETPAPNAQGPAKQAPGGRTVGDALRAADSPFRGKKPPPGKTQEPSPPPKEASLPSPMRFEHPRTASNERLHSCLELPHIACGEPAAEAFCKSKGYTKLVSFRAEKGRLRSETWFGEICSRNDCRPYVSIICAN